MEINNKKNGTKNLEDNRWIANHIIEILQGYQNGLSSNKEIFERTSKDLLLKLEKGLNNILSVFITIITLIIGLSSLDPLKEILNHNSPWTWIAIGIILVAVVLLALIIYIRKNKEISDISRKLVDVEKEYYDGYTTQNFLKGFFSRYVEKPNKLDNIQLQLLNSFFLIVQGAIVCNIFIKSIEKLNYFKQPYNSFKSSEYSTNLFLLVTEYAYNSYTNLVKSQGFVSYDIMSNNDLKARFRDVDREKLLRTIWDDKIKKFIEEYEKLKKEYSKSR